MSFLKSGFSKLPKYKKFNYAPRYYDPEEEERKEMFDEEHTLKMEKGAFFNQKNKSRIAGAFTEHDVIYRNRRSKGQFSRVILLALMLTLPILYIIGKLNGVVTIGGLLILLIVFIVRVNRF